MESSSKNLIFGIVIGVVIFAFILLIYNENKPQPIQKLTDEDFKIIDASWNIYQTKYDNVQQTYVPDTNLPEVNWAYICKTEPSQAIANWQITTMQTISLVCDFYADGVKDTTNSLQTFLKNGTTYFGLGMNLNPSNNHNIKICCTANAREKNGEVCKSITLSAKC